MGISWDSKCILGWRISCKDLINYIKQKNPDLIKDEKKYYPSFGEFVKIIKETIELPRGWEIIVTTPYTDTEFDQWRYSLGLSFEENICLTDISQLLESSDLEGACKLAQELDCNDPEKPKLYSNYDIW